MMSAQPWVGKSVLIVDDSAGQRELMANLFRELGFSIKGFANNGVEAITQYEQQKPDLVSLDIVMPDMHGVDCYRHLQSKHPNFKGLFISCLGGEHIVGQNFTPEFPNHLFLGKPVDLAKLESSLQLIFAQSAAA